MTDTKSLFSAVPQVGQTVWVWFCNACGLCEGSSMQAGCCRHCGMNEGSTRFMVRVEVEE